MRTFFKSIIGLIIIIILALVIVIYIGKSRLPDMLANNLSKKLGVSVSIGEIDLSWGSIQINKVEIGNLPNYTLQKAFSSDTINVVTPLTNYLDKNVIINEIDVDGIYLGLEFDSTTSATGNWSKIMQHANASTPSTPTDEKNKRTVLIHKLVLTNISVDIVYRSDGGKVKRLPKIDQIVLTDVSSEGGVPMDQIMNSVLGQMLKQVFLKENLQNMIEGILQNQGGSTLDKIISPFKGLLNQ